VWEHKTWEAAIRRHRCPGGSGTIRLTFHNHLRDTEDDLKISLRIVSTILPLLLPSFTLETGPCVPGHLYTLAMYVLEKIVENFGKLLLQLKDHHLIHTYRVVLHFCQLENIDYLVLRYINTGALPSNKYSGEWLFDGEV